MPEYAVSIKRTIVVEAANAENALIVAGEQHFEDWEEDEPVIKRVRSA